MQVHVITMKLIAIRNLGKYPVGSVGWQKDGFTEGQCRRAGVKLNVRFSLLLLDLIVFSLNFWWGDVY